MFASMFANMGPDMCFACDIIARYLWIFLFILFLWSRRLLEFGTVERVLLGNERRINLFKFARFLSNLFIRELTTFVTCTGIPRAVTWVRPAYGRDHPCGLRRVLFDALLTVRVLGATLDCVFTNWERVICITCTFFFKTCVTLYSHTPASAGCNLMRHSTWTNTGRRGREPPSTRGHALPGTECGQPRVHAPCPWFLSSCSCSCQCPDALNTRF